MLNYFIVCFLFDLNLVISIKRKTTTLETIAKSVVVDACKSYKSLERKSCAKTLLSFTNTRSLLSFFIYIFFTLSTTTLELATTFYTIY